MPIITTLPQADVDMTYVLKAHRYVLTKAAIENEFGIDLTFWLGDAKKIPIFINQISRQIYYYIYEHHFAEEKNLMQWALAKEIDWREILREAMLAQVEYALISSGNLVALQTGFNVEKGTMADLNKIRNLQVAVQVNQILGSAGILYSNSPKLLNYKMQFLGETIRLDY